MIKEADLSEMRNSKEKQLLMILKEGGKPVVRKVDGFAVVVDEDKPIKYQDYDDTELTMTIPKGSVVFCEPGNDYPKIITPEDFNEKYKFLEESKPKKDSEENKLSITQMND